MKVLLTGSSGRIGRAIFARLSGAHQVVGYDIAPAPTTRIVALLEDQTRLRAALEGVDAVVHTAALHAPHVGVREDAAFEAVNVIATEKLAHLCIELGVRRFLYTSTTALYGVASTPAGKAAWITEDTLPLARTIYHHTKLQAEARLEAIAAQGILDVTVLRMSRCFPEPAPTMAAYRLHRGVDARDVAAAHQLALEQTRTGFHRYIVSGVSPFMPEDIVALYENAPVVLQQRSPALVAAFQQRGWPLPASIDRVYDATKAQRELGWQPVYGFEEVLAERDRLSPEVLP